VSHWHAHIVRLTRIHFKYWVALACYIIRILPEQDSQALFHVYTFEKSPQVHMPRDTIRESKPDRVTLHSSSSSWLSPAALSSPPACGSTAAEGRGGGAISSCRAGTTTVLAPTGRIATMGASVSSVTGDRALLLVGVLIILPRGAGGERGKPLDVLRGN
jgi:hypothetical protein